MNKQFENFNWINILEKDDEITPADYLGRPTESMLHSILEQSNVGVQTHYFICGPEAMMKIVNTGLEQYGILSKQIQIEKFRGNYLIEILIALVK